MKIFPFEDYIATYTHSRESSGSIAAAFQSWMYGGFTPAAGVFATLTSLGMLGFANPVCGLISGVTATLAAGLTWVLLGGPG